MVINLSAIDGLDAYSEEIGISYELTRYRKARNNPDLMYLNFYSYEISRKVRVELLRSLPSATPENIEQLLPYFSEATVWRYIEAAKFIDKVYDISPMGWKFISHSLEDTYG